MPPQPCTLCPAQPVARGQSVARDTGLGCPRRSLKREKPLLTFSLAKPRYNAKAALKNKLFIYGKYITLLIQYEKMC